MTKGTTTKITLLASNSCAHVITVITLSFRAVLEVSLDLIAHNAPNTRL